MIPIFIFRLLLEIRFSVPFQTLDPGEMFRHCASERSFAIPKELILLLRHFPESGFASYRR
jgi:hypothetical protein